MMYQILRPVLFLMKPEAAHYFAMRMFGILLRIPGIKDLFKSKENPGMVDGLYFKNRVGLAAGFDKDGKFLRQVQSMGFGFVEVGTVTPRPQDGNPKPRLFRLPKDHALINRMGFNNEGVEALKQRLIQFRQEQENKTMLIGINIGKNKDTPNSAAVSDYNYCYTELYEQADFFVVNVSSPNTPNLRELQNKAELHKIISALLDIREKQSEKKPLYLKIAPDLSFEQLEEIIALREELRFEGIVATNTSIDRNLLKNTDPSFAEAIGAGGLSGAPVLEISNAFVQYIRSKSNMTIIGVGGIENEAGGISKLEAGANLIEIYTGFIYGGPGLVKRLAGLEQISNL